MKKIMKNRISVKDFAEELNVIEVVESYDYDCCCSECDEFDTDFAHLYTIDEFDSFEIQDTEEGKILIIHKKSWGLCTECDMFGDMDKRDKESEKIYCSDMPRPEGFEYITKYHGLAAYSRTFTPKESMSNAINLVDNPHWEICCSTRAIGPIGLIIEGTTITASNVDLCSKIDNSNGKRYFEIIEDDYRAYKGIIHYAYQLEKQWDHDEIVTKDNIVTAVWIKDWAINEFKEIAEVLCEKLNVSLKIIKTEK